MKGNKAVFEVFTEDPIVIENGKAKKKENVKSILKAYTDNACKYSGIVNLPTACTKIYLYSENYILPTSVEIEVDNSDIKFNLEDYKDHPSFVHITIHLSIHSRKQKFVQSELGKQPVQYPISRGI